MDFLIYNRIGKNPILAIEVDGYVYHKQDAVQAHRDLLKNKILKLYNIFYLIKKLETIFLLMKKTKKFVCKKSAAVTLRTN